MELKNTVQCVYMKINRHDKNIHARFSVNFDTFVRFFGLNQEKIKKEAYLAVCLAQDL